MLFMWIFHKKKTLNILIIGDTTIKHEWIIKLFTYSDMGRYDNNCIIAYYQYYFHNFGRKSTFTQPISFKYYCLH